MQCKVNQNAHWPISRLKVHIDSHWTHCIMIMIIIIIIQPFVRHTMSANTMSANILNLRRRQSLGEEDGGSEV